LRLAPTSQAKELINQVKTRWNSYYAVFARTIELQRPLNNYAEHELDENRHIESIARCARRPDAREPAPLRLYLREGGLHADDWATITEAKS
jgi:hypothetical protein